MAGAYPGPVIANPIELLVGLVGWVALLVTVVAMVQKCSGSTIKDMDGDGIPDLNS